MIPKGTHSNFYAYRLEKGVIVYICDSRGVRDIYDTDGTNAVAASEPLAVLVSLHFDIIYSYMYLYYELFS